MHDDSLIDNVVECMFYVFLIPYGYLSLGMLYWEYRRVCPDGVGPRHVANGVKGVGESLLQCHYVLNLGSGTRGSCLG